MTLEPQSTSSSIQDLQKEKDGYVTIEDLVAVFAQVPNVKRNEAVLIAQTILSKKKGVLESEDALDTRESSDRINFIEFMTLLEGCDSLDFSRYKSLVKYAAKYNLDEESRQAAEEAYDVVEAGITLEDASAKEPNEASKPGGAVKPGQLKCFQCKMVFGVPPGASMVACPSCRTTQTIPESEAALNFDILPFRLPFGGLQHRKHPGQHAAPPAQHAAPPAGGMVPPPSAFPAGARYPTPLPVAHPTAHPTAVPVPVAYPTAPAAPMSGPSGQPGPFGPHTSAQAASTV